MKNGFDRALVRVLHHEGGYVNHPKDPGGATNQGVTQRTYDSYRVTKKLKTRSVRLLEARERDDIYRAQYWTKVMGDDLPAGLDFVMFDGAVNSGPSQSIKWLQRALGRHYTGNIDGAMGQMTLAGIANHGNVSALIDAVLDRRLSFLQALTTWGTFGKGWSSRITDVRRTGKAWANAAPSPAPVASPASATQKGRIEDAKKIPGTGAADALTGGGLGSAGAVTVINEAKDTLLPLAGSGTFVNNIVVILIVAGVVLTVGGIAIRAYNKRRAKKLVDALDLDERATNASLGYAA